MPLETEIPVLDNLEFLPYLDNEGLLDENLSGKIGIYAIFDQNRNLQFVGYFFKM